MAPFRFRSRFLKVKEEKRTQTQTFWSGYLQVGWGLPREGVGCKKFGMSIEAQRNQTFWRDIPGFLPGYPGGSRKVWEKVYVQFSSRRKTAAKVPVQISVPRRAVPTVPVSGSGSVPAPSCWDEAEHSCYSSVGPGSSDTCLTEAIRRIARWHADQAVVIRIWLEEDMENFFIWFSCWSSPKKFLYSRQAQKDLTSAQHAWRIVNVRNEWMRLIVPWPCLLAVLSVPATHWHTLPMLTEGFHTSKLARRRRWWGGLYKHCSRWPNDAGPYG